MVRYALRRLLQMVPVILAIVVLNFVLIRLAPGDPTYYFIGDPSGVSPELYTQIRAELGLDRPIIEQLGIYLTQVATGDLGYSYVSREPVVSLILGRLPATLLLMVSQLALAVWLGMGLGTLASRHRGTALDGGVTTASVIAYGVPVFALGQLLIILFAIKLDVFPIGGYSSSDSSLPKVIDVAHHLVLPAVTLALTNIALIARVTRTSMVDVMDQDFVNLARAKGLSTEQVTYRHVRPNGMLPVITVIGLNIRNIIAGAVLVETVFGWPGIGRLTYDSVVARDYPTVLGILLLTGAAVAVGNLLTDLAYARVDPRVRLG